jgi:hypothetical protein
VIDCLDAAAPKRPECGAERRGVTLGRWVAAGAFDQGDVEDALYVAAELNGLVDDDGDRQSWATARCWCRPG